MGPSLDAPPPAPTLDLAPSQSEEQASPLPDPSSVASALRDRVGTSLAPDQASTLVAASALTVAGAGHDSGTYAADVTRAFGDPNPDQTVTNAQTYLDGGGAVPEGLVGTFRDPVVLAQSQSLSRLDRADFSLITPERKLELEQVAEQYVTTYANGRTQRVRGDFREPDLGDSGAAGIPQRESYSVPRIDFNDLRGIVQDIADRPDMGDIDKAYVWNTIAGMKGDAKIVEYENARLHIDNAGVRPGLIDDDRAWNTSNHTVVPFTDGYHGFGGNGMANGSLSDAYQRIEEHEDSVAPGLGRVPVLGRNEGDIAASRATVEAFHVWRDAPDGRKFAAFADSWSQLVVQ